MGEFIGFPKIARLNREVIVSEKIDGTNAAISIDDFGYFYVQSRTRIITPDDDNFGFAKWAYANKDWLIETLGPGLHFGEWWGLGIQRGYGMKTKGFAPFNAERWADLDIIVDNVLVRPVPILYKGKFDQDAFQLCVDGLRLDGSKMVPGWMTPEGIVIWHTQGRFGLKVTLEKDEAPKGHPEA